MKSDLFFCGIKHSGKSKLGSLIASAWHCPWTDADDLVVASLPPGMTVRSYYREYGKEAFQKQETETLSRFLASPHAWGIISLGGGASDNPDVMALCKQHGPLVYLRCPEEVLFRRIMVDGIPPFLDADNPASSFHALYLKRDNAYGKYCSFMVDLPDSPTVEETARYLKSILEGANDGAQHLRP